LDLLASEVPSDTLATVMLLRNRFPASLPMCPLVVASHIYSIVSDRTSVDRQLEELNRNKKIQIIRLASDRVDYGIVLWADYTSLVNSCKEGKGKEWQDLLDWFVNRLVQRVTHCYVDDCELEKELRSFLRARGGDVGLHGDWVKRLVQSGLITRRMSVHGGYWFSVPNLGIFVKSLRAGRKRLAGILKRRKRCEILQWDLEKMKLPKTTLGMQYQLRDAIGSGLFEQIETTCGPLLRLANKTEKL